MLRSNFVYNPALKCMSYNGEVLEITSSGLEKYRLAQMFNYSTKAYWRYFAKPLL